MITRFESVPVPQAIGECHAIADALQSALGDVLEPVRFESMRQSLHGYEQLSPQEQADFRAAMGWRKAMFLEDGWLHDQLDAPRPADRAAFAAWSRTQLEPVRQRMARGDGMSSSGAASSADSIVAKTRSRDDLIADAERTCKLDLSGYGALNHWTHKRLPIDWFPDQSRMNKQVVHLAMRFTTFIPLVGGYVANGERKYLDMAYRLIADITWQVPGNVLIRWGIRTHWGIDALDVALRSYNLLELIGNGSGIDQSPGFSDDALMLLWKNTFWCGARGQEFWHPQNHNILFFESSNLAALGFYFPAFKDAKLWRESGQQRMIGGLRGAVLSDGCNVEAAPRYHFIYLREPYLTVKASEDAGIPLVEDFVETARRQGAKMANYWACVGSPTGTIPSLGDSSAMQCRAQLRISAEYYGAPFALAATSDDPTQWPAEKSAYLPQNRLAVMRSGWGPDDLWLVYALRGWHHGHDHRDTTHFELQAGSRQLLLDSGSIDYEANRLRGQETRAHNTLVVDDAIQFDGGTHDIRWYSNEHFDWCEALNVGFPGILHRRAICFLKPDCFVVLDRVTFNGPATRRKFDFHYHLPHDAKLTFDDRIAASNDADQWNIRLDFMGEPDWTLTRTEGFLAVGYLREVVGPVATFSACRDKGFTCVTLIQPTPPHRPPVATAKLIDVRATNGGPGTVIGGADGVGATIEHGTARWTLLWTDTGIGEKQAGELTTDGDLLIQRNDRIYVRRGSYVTQGQNPAPSEALHDQSEHVPD